MPIKVLIVDDTILYRKLLSDIFSELPDVEVVGTANNGQIALSRIKSLRPDLVTLDVEMPIMNGLQLLEEINKENINVSTIMLSSETLAGSRATIRALELGAFDFISKPADASAQVNKTIIEKSIRNALKAFKRRRVYNGTLLAKPSGASQLGSANQTASLKRVEKSKVVAIGVSTGGPNALARMIPMLPGDLGVPVLLVQHMPALFTDSLARSLDNKSALTVREAVNGEELKPNTVYVAPGDTQMMVASGGGMKKVIRISPDAPRENNCRPSVDYLFRSIAREYGSRSTCVVMTGMGADGKLGMAVTKAGGAFSIAQDEQTSVVYGMPKAVADAGLVDLVVPLDLIAEAIVKSVK